MKSVSSAASLPCHAPASTLPISSHARDAESFDHMGVTDTPPSASSSAGAMAALQQPLAPGPEPMMRRFDRFTDRIVDLAGSAPALGAAALFELGWLIAGRPARFSDGWQLVMSDVSTVVVFWMNPVLQNAENRHKAAMLRRFGQAAEIARVLAARVREQPLAWREVEGAEHECNPGHLTWFDRAVDAVGGVVGSPGGFAVAVAGVAAWAGSGAALHWSDTWQLIINSATSAFELPAAMALHNTKIRRDTLLGAAVVDDIAHGEDLLRHLGYADLPVEPAAKPHVRRSPLRKAVDWVVKVEGSAPALAVQVGLTLLWPALGPRMHWSNDWQLVLGTATTIPSYVFLLVLMYAQNRHIADMRRDGLAMEANYLTALEHVDAPLAARRRQEFASAAPKMGWLTRITDGCNRFAGSPLGVSVGVGALPLWGASKAFLNFTTWMLVINTGTMIAQTLSFILLMESHGRADRWAHERLRRGRLVREDLRAALGGEAEPCALSEIVVESATDAAPAEHPAEAAPARRGWRSWLRSTS